MDAVEGEGVSLNNVTIRNWKGTEKDGEERGPIKVLCASGAPCTDISIEDFALWTETGDGQTYHCENAYGSGFCLEEGEGDSPFTTTQTASSTPSAYSAPRMSDDLSSAYGTASEIPIPTIPTSFFPGATPFSALAGDSAASTPAASSSAGASAYARFAAAKPTTAHGSSHRHGRYHYH